MRLARVDAYAYPQLIKHPQCDPPSTEGVEGGVEGEWGSLISLGGVHCPLHTVSRNEYHYAVLAHFDDVGVLWVWGRQGGGAGKHDVGVLWKGRMWEEGGGGLSREVL